MTSGCVSKQQLVIAAWCSILCKDVSNKTGTYVEVMAAVGCSDPSSDICREAVIQELIDLDMSNLKGCC